MQQKQDTPSEIAQLIVDKFKADENVQAVFGDKFSTDAFANNISKNTIVEDIVDKVTTTLDPEVRSQRIMLLNAPSDVYCKT